MQTGALPSTISATAANDAEAIAGTSTVKVAVPANLPAAVPHHAAKVANARATAQRWAYDGTYGAGFRWAFGSGDFALLMKVKVSALGTVQYLIGGAANAFALYIDASGYLVAKKMGGASLTASTAALVAGQEATIAYVRDGTASRYYIDGQPAGSASDGANDYSVASTFLGSTTDATTSVFTGTLVPPSIWNYALSDADILARHTAGGPLAQDFNAASDTSLATGWTNSSFTSFTGASATGFTAVRASGTGTCWCNTLAFKRGRKIRITGTLALNNGKTVYPRFYTFGGSLPAITLAAAGAFDIELVPATTQTEVVVVDATGDSDFTLSNLSVTRVGVVSAPQANARGYEDTWPDLSGSGTTYTMPASGVEWVVRDSVQPVDPTSRAQTTGMLVSANGTARQTSKIYGLGDSLTYNDYLTGLVALMGSAWSKVNRGVSGNTTTQMLARFGADVAAGNDAAVVIVWGGINDICAGDSAATIHARLQTLYSAAKATGAIVVALNVTPFKASADWTAGRQTVTDALNTLIAGSSTDVDLNIDLYTLMEDPGTPDTLLAAYDSGDGLHHGAGGRTFVAQTIFARLTALATLGSLKVGGGFGCNGASPQTPYASGGLLAGVVAALIAHGILSS